MKKISFFLLGIFLSVLLFETSLFADPEKKFSVSESYNEPVRLNFDNFLGKDTSVRATGRLTENYLFLKAGVEKRRMFERPYFAGIDIAGRAWAETEFDMQGWGLDFYIGREIAKFTRVSGRYRFDRYEVSNTDPKSEIDFRRQDGTMEVSALSLDLEKGAVDDPFYPTQGTKLNLLAEYSLKALGGDFNFSKYEAAAAYFITPFWDITFGAHAHIGWMEDFGSSVEVPFYERWFAGSSSTVRGFRWGGAGPISPQNAALGGDVLMTGNLEARLPIYKKLKGVIFFDTGRAFNKLDDLGHIDFREAAGLGVRYLTPWVVLRADYGFTLDKRDDEDTSRLHLTLGMPF